MTDIWPIENVWTHVKKKSEEEFQNLTLLKQRIITVWNTITLQMCSKWTNSTPTRLQSLMKKKRYLINKNDYSNT